MKKTIIIATLISTCLGITISLTPTQANASKWTHSTPYWSRGHWYSKKYKFIITKHHVDFKRKSSVYWHKYTHAKMIKYNYASQDVKIYRHGNWHWINFGSEGHNKITYTYGGTKTGLFYHDPITLHRY